jgi:hypothetical protein
MEWLKAHIKGLMAAISTIAVIIGTAFSIDLRYAKATDIEPIRELSIQSINQIRIEQANTIDLLRKQQLEDRLFELRLRENPSRTDNALILRYENQLNEVDANIRLRSFPSRSLGTGLPTQ